jgi:hypothetical protein
VECIALSPRGSDRSAVMVSQSGARYAGFETRTELSRHTFTSPFYLPAVGDILPFLRWLLGSA